MDEAKIRTLVDLVIDLDRAGVQELIPDGDRLRYRPRSALTPDLAGRLRTHKGELLAILGPAEGPDGAPTARMVDSKADPPVGTMFEGWVCRQDSRGRMGWERADLRDAITWWRWADFDDLPEPVSPGHFGDPTKREMG